MGEPRPPRLARTLAKLTGARLVFGKAVSAEGVTIVPVARVRAAGGGGSSDEGDGGAGAMAAAPIGYVEMRGGATRFRRIRAFDPLVAGAIVTLAAALTYWRWLSRI